MSVLCNNTNGVDGSYYAKDGMVGSGNLRAAHTLCMRTRFTALPTTVDAYGCAFVDFQSGNGSALARYANATSNNWNALRTSSFTPGTSDQAVTTGYADTTTWRHFALTYDATNIRSYINGVLQNTTASATTRTNSSTNTSLNAYGVFQGVMCDVAVFSRVLTADELLMLANSRLAPVLSKGDCFGYYPGFFSNIVKDYSGRGNDLTSVPNLGSSPAANNEDPGVGWALQRSRRIYFVSSPEQDIAAAGTTQCTGTASLTIERQIAAAGTTQVNGTADLRAGSNAAGSTLVTGTAAMTMLAQLTAAGQTQCTGAAAMTLTGALSAGGSTQCYGTADLQGSGPGPGGTSSRVRIWRRGPRYGR